MKKYNALTNIEIDSYFQNRPEFLGCFAKDRLPKIFIPNKFFIVNLEDYNQGGSHWVMLITTNDFVLYFDPFGVVPPLEVLQFMKISRKPSYYSTTDLQNIKSSLCGYYCIYIIDQIMAGRKFLNIMQNDFTNNQTNNDKVIMKYFKDVKF